jgi:hypothetical protein
MHEYMLAILQCSSHVVVVWLMCSLLYLFYMREREKKSKRISILNVFENKNTKTPLYSFKLKSWFWELFFAFGNKWKIHFFLILKIKIRFLRLSLKRIHISRAAFCIISLNALLSQMKILFCFKKIISRGFFSFLYEE